MKAWNKKRKPKHWTKPKWKMKDKGLIKLIMLISNNMKKKINFFLRKYFMPKILIFKAPHKKK